MPEVKECRFCGDTFRTECDCILSRLEPGKGVKRFGRASTVEELLEVVAHMERADRETSKADPFPLKGIVGENYYTDIREMRAHYEGAASAYGYVAGHLNRILSGKG
jgi:hypothetical protein